MQFTPGDNRGTFARYRVPDNVNEVVAGSRTSCLSKLAGKRSASPGKPANSIAGHVARSSRGVESIIERSHRVPLHPVRAFSSACLPPVLPFSRVHDISTPYAKVLLTRDLFFIQVNILLRRHSGLFTVLSMGIIFRNDCYFYI